MLSLRSSGKIVGSSVSIRQLAQQHNLSFSDLIAGVIPSFGDP